MHVLTMYKNIIHNNNVYSSPILSSAYPMVAAILFEVNELYKPIPPSFGMVLLGSHVLSTGDPGLLGILLLVVSGIDAVEC